MNAHRTVDTSQATPYAGLTPGLVLDALDSVGLRGDGRLLQLNSYENRVFQVFLEDGSVVVPKFYRPGRWSDSQILEEHVFSAQLAAEEVPVVAPLQLSRDEHSELVASLAGTPPTLAQVQSGGDSYRFAVMPRRSGRAPSLESLEHLEWIGRFIGRMHSIGAREPFQHRLTLSVEEFGWNARNWLSEHGTVPPDAMPAWTSAVDTALALVADAFDRVGPCAAIRLHGDCHLGNLLWTEAGPHFVDLDDALNGPAVQDLWMLLSGEPAQRRRELDAVLTGYEAFMDFDDRQLGLIEALRTLRLIHHSAWLARRWNDPAFPVAFPWFGEAAYWQQQTQVLKEQHAALKEST